MGVSPPLLGPADGPGSCRVAFGEQGGDGLLPGCGFALDFGAGFGGTAARSGSVFASAMCSAMAIWISSVTVPVPQLSDEAQLSVDVRLEPDAKGLDAFGGLVGCGHSDLLGAVRPVSAGCAYGTAA